jgi:hypothetical protein
LLLVLGCRPGEGDNCVCEGECRGGLVCAQGGKVLEQDVCVNTKSSNAEPGRCIEADNADGDDGAALTDAPDKHDVGGKRDFEGPSPMTSADDGIGSASSESTAASSGGTAAASSESTAAASSESTAAASSESTAAASSESTIGSSGTSSGASSSGAP